MEDDIKEELKKIRIACDKLFVKGFGDYNSQQVESFGRNFASMVNQLHSVFCIESIGNDSMKLRLLSSDQEVVVPFDKIKDKPVELSKGFINNEKGEQKVYVYEITLKEGYHIISIPFPTSGRENLEVVPEEEKKVLEALEDSKWDFRTIEGIVRATGLSNNKVREIIQKQGRYILKSSIPDQQGQELYTLWKKKTKIIKAINEMRVFISKSVF